MGHCRKLRWSQKAIRILSVISTLFVDLISLSPSLSLPLSFVSPSLYMMGNVVANGSWALHLLVSTTFLLVPNQKVLRKRLISSALGRHLQVTCGRVINILLNYMILPLFDCLKMAILLFKLIIIAIINNNSWVLTMCKALLSAVYKYLLIYICNNLKSKVL